MRRLSSGKPEDRLENFTTAQRRELDGYIDRFNRFGLQPEAQQRMTQLQNLLGALANIPGPVGTALGIYEQMTGAIVGMLGKIDEAEYQTFKQQMGGTTGRQATERFAQIQGAYRPQLVTGYWIRYQAELLRARGAR